MAEIRRADDDDLNTLVGMLQALHAESPAYRDEPFEPAMAHAWLWERGLDANSEVFVAERGGRIVGMLVAIAVPRWFNSLSIAAELLLYIQPASRGGRAFPQLVAAFKAWAAERGASKAFMGVSTGICPERTVCAYEGLGFKLDGYNVTTTL